jgi:hypothetical protein
LAPHIARLGGAGDGRRVPHTIGELNCDYLFGQPDDSSKGHMNCPENGLLLLDAFEKAMDGGRFMIFPASTTWHTLFY